MLLPESTQTVYAQLLDELTGAALPSRGLTFVARKVGGHRYWYMQVVIGSERQSFYVGPDNDAVRGRVEAARSRWEAERLSGEVRSRLVEMLRSGGAFVPSAAHARVLEAMAQAGVFLMGGVLVGSHAFGLLGNALGTRWDKGTTRTADVDLAHDNRIFAAVPNPPRSIDEILEDTGLGFFAVPALRNDAPSTGFKVRGRELSVSLLTPMRGRTETKPRRIAALGAMAEPLRFLEYILEDTQQVVVPVRQGFLVSVPSAARFALHKLVVSQRREAAFATKARKDVAQAEQVLAFLEAERPGELRLALDAARVMPKRFRALLLEAAGQLREELHEVLRAGVQGDP